MTLFIFNFQLKLINQNGLFCLYISHPRRKAMFNTISNVDFQSKQTFADWRSTIFLPPYAELCFVKTSNSKIKRTPFFSYSDKLGWWCKNGKNSINPTGFSTFGILVDNKKKKHWVNSDFKQIWWRLLCNGKKKKKRYAYKSRRWKIYLQKPYLRVFVREVATRNLIDVVIRLFYK